MQRKLLKSTSRNSRKRLGSPFSKMVESDGKLRFDGLVRWEPAKRTITGLNHREDLLRVRRLGKSAKIKILIYALKVENISFVRERKSRRLARLKQGQGRSGCALEKSEAKHLRQKRLLWVAERSVVEEFDTLGWALG